MRVKKSNCIGTVEGKVLGLKSRGLDKPTVISVAYTVNGNSYVVEETLKLKSEITKFGFLPIGVNRIPVMGDIRMGSITSVKYNPANPIEAYIIGNVGKGNV